MIFLSRNDKEFFKNDLKLLRCVGVYVGDGEEEDVKDEEECEYIINEVWLFSWIGVIIILNF